MKSMNSNSLQLREILIQDRYDATLSNNMRSYARQLSALYIIYNDIEQRLNAEITHYVSLKSTEKVKSTSISNWKETLITQWCLGLLFFFATNPRRDRYHWCSYSTFSKEKERLIVLLVDYNWGWRNTPSAYENKLWLSRAASKLVRNYRFYVSSTMGQKYAPRIW